MTSDEGHRGRRCRARGPDLAPAGHRNFFQTFKGVLVIFPAQASEHPDRHHARRVAAGSPGDRHPARTVYPSIARDERNVVGDARRGDELVRRVPAKIELSDRAADGRA
jgi:hypothetical protein